MRQAVSLLLSQGHPHARAYPIGLLWLEVEIVRDRLDAATVTQAVLMQGALASIESKKGGRHFEKLIRKLQDG